MMKKNLRQRASRRFIHITLAIYIHTLQKRLHQSSDDKSDSTLFLVVVAVAGYVMNSTRNFAEDRALPFPPTGLEKA
jgi:hypothetical protein